MSSNNVIVSILSQNFTTEHGETVDVVRYRCDLPPPFFEGHRLFLEPASRIHCNDHILATFQWIPMAKSPMTLSRLRELVNLFVFLEEHELSFNPKDVKNKFVLRGEALVLIRPWELRHDTDAQKLAECQATIFKIFEGPHSLSAAALNCWEQFGKGISPKRLMKHPAVWSAEKAKCFLLDVADSRFHLRAGPLKHHPAQKGASKFPFRPPPRPLPETPTDWIIFMEGCDLKQIIRAQKSIMRKGRSHFLLMGKISWIWQFVLLTSCAISMKTA